MAEILALTVTGMKCAGCEATVKKQLQQAAGILAVNAWHKENKVEIEFAPETISPAQIAQIITTAGFEIPAV